MVVWITNGLEKLLDFSNILNASIAASWLVLAVILLRFLLKKAPRWTHVALYGLVAVRLLLPFSIESAFSLIPSTETVPQKILMYEGTLLQEPAHLDIITNPMYSDGITVALSQTVDRVQIHMIDMAFFWLTGIAVLLLYTAISYWGLRRKVDTAVLYRDNIFESENVSSPFVLGIIKPRIYLPFKMDEQDLHHIIAHEQAHIRRKDHWWKPLGFLLLTFHWFNPFMWLAYVFLCRDIELACDEKVIKELDSKQRADYTQALLSCSVNRRGIAACPLSFGEVGVKERVKSVMNYKKPAFYIIILSVITCIVIAVCFLTNPINPGDYVKLTKQGTPGRNNQVMYEMELGNQVMSGVVYAEQWNNGTCIRSTPVILTQQVENIQILMSDRRENNSTVGIDIQIDTDEYGGSLITYFAFPEDHSIMGWSFTAYKENETVKIAPKDEVILAAMAFDEGNGVRAIDCESLINEPKRLENADYTIVIRACFSSESLGTQSKEPAS